MANNQALVHPDASTGRFAPFVRVDKYGDMGYGPLSTWEKFKLLVLSFTLLPIKSLAALICLVAYYSACRVCTLLPEPARSTAIVYLGKVACRTCLFVMGFVSIKWVKVTPADAPSNGDVDKQPVNDEDYSAIVSNHVSWADILVHMSRSFPSFVARDGTQKLPFVGLISRLMGCLYVERENKSATYQGVSALVKERMLRYAAGKPAPGERPMLLFPEGTTSNGQYLLPFKSGAFLGGVPVKPVILKYDQNNVSPTWETCPAKRHLQLMLANPVHSVTAYELPVYHPSEEEKQDPKLYAANVREYMLRVSGLQPSDSVLQDKRDYSKLLLERHSASKKSQ